MRSAPSPNRSGAITAPCALAIQTSSCHYHASSTTTLISIYIRACRFVMTGETPCGLSRGEDRSKFTTRSLSVPAPPGNPCPIDGQERIRDRTTQMRRCVFLHKVTRMGHEEGKIQFGSMAASFESGWKQKRQKMAKAAKCFFAFLALFVILLPYNRVQRKVVIVRLRDFFV